MARDLARRDDDREEMVTPAHRVLRELAPREDLDKIRRLMGRVPENLHPYIEEATRLSSHRMTRLLIGAAAAFYVRETLKANSAVGLYPIGINPGANVPVNTIVPLQPMTGGVTAGPYQFVTNQVFFQFVTSKVDSDNGFQFASNSVRFANDPLPGMAYGDTPLFIFQTDVVAGRSVRGEYSMHTVIEQLSFFASIILYNAAPKPFVGLALEFWDKRCEGEGVSDRYLRVFQGPSFLDIVEDLCEKANGGMSIAAMFGDSNIRERLLRAGD